MMPTYRVSWIHRTRTFATVTADSEAEAIEKAKCGEHNDDVDTEPGKDDARTFKVDAEIAP
jgi:hypothetical protein